MTVIAAVTDGKTWCIGGDSGIFDEDISVYSHSSVPKVWRVGETLFGVAGHWRAGEIARESRLEDPLAIRDKLKEAGIEPDWDILAVTRKGITFIGDDFAVIHQVEKYSASGAAVEIAIGSLHTSMLLKHDPYTAVEFALKAATSISTKAAKPYKILTLGEKKEKNV